MKKCVALFTALFLTMTLTLPALAASKFPDVDQKRDAWCYEPIAKATNLGIMKGYGNGLFGKNDLITRSQIVQILYNRYGKDLGAASGLKDVPETAWYAKAVVWALDKGIVTTYPDNTFGVNNPLSRQQLVTILYNNADRPSVDPDSILSDYTDYDEVSPYAKEPFAWAVEKGIITGTSKTTLAPHGMATRAQLAVIMIRYIERTENIEIPAPAPEVEKPKPAPATAPQNSDGTTNAAAVNKIHNVKKDNKYPTTGASSVPNANGYYTAANVDISGAELSYDALDRLNKYLTKQELAPARWVKSDEMEEYTLMRAAEFGSGKLDGIDDEYWPHIRPDGSDTLSAENAVIGAANAYDAILSWEFSPGHKRLLNASEGSEVCIAHYESCWIMTVWGDNRLQDMIEFSKNNYYGPKWDD